jgi:Bacterial regulatory helix-turn-helix protein, lysR family
VHPVQRWRGELAAEFGWLPGDQGAVAAAGAADVEDGPVRLAYHAVPGFGDAVTVEVQPDDGEVLALLQCLTPGGGFAPAGRAGQGGPRSSGASPRAGGRLTDAGMDRGLGDIRRAAQDSPAGWLRLGRFQTAMTSPTIAAAAARLRICPSALSHQLRRLERDSGARLYQPATTRRPWRPTGRGAALLTALAQPGTQALAATHAPQISGRAGSRYRDRMPISLGPDAADARQAASLFRVLASPTRLAILLTLQAGEQRITDLAARLGGS